MKRKTLYRLYDKGAWRTYDDIRLYEWFERQYSLCGGHRDRLKGRCPVRFVHIWF